ncbi:hypothetical protein [Stenotrophomonas pigmentata]|uniref:hypothetical protein n=1 Tax=Stenotrophomonas pigmentata TaxID=3055080 RepID=UPI0026ED2600|nr:hypothetical protein [Stenotrophomonas sp. 610A2]
MSSPSILIHTLQRFPLRFTFTPAWDSISASLYVRPTNADRKIGIETGRQPVFVAGHPAQRIRLTEPDDTGDDWAVWLAGTAFDIDAKTHARLKAWIADTFTSKDGEAPR